MFTSLSVYVCECLCVPCSCVCVCVCVCARVWVCVCAPMHGLIPFYLISTSLLYFVTNVPNCYKYLIVIGSSQLPVGPISDLIVYTRKNSHR